MTDTYHLKSQPFALQWPCVAVVLPSGETRWGTVMSSCRWMRTIPRMSVGRNTCPDKSCDVPSRPTRRLLTAAGWRSGCMSMRPFLMISWWSVKGRFCISLRAMRARCCGSFISSFLPVRVRGWTWPTCRRHSCRWKATAEILLSNTVVFTRRPIPTRS